MKLYVLYLYGNLGKDKMPVGNDFKFNVTLNVCIHTI